MRRRSPGQEPHGDRGAAVNGPRRWTSVTAVSPRLRRESPDSWHRFRSRRRGRRTFRSEPRRELAVADAPRCSPLSSPARVRPASPVLACLGLSAVPTSSSWFPLSLRAGPGVSIQPGLLSESGRRLRPCVFLSGRSKAHRFRGRRSRLAVSGRRGGGAGRSCPKRGAGRRGTRSRAAWQFQPRRGGPASDSCLLGRQSCERGGGH